MEALIKCRTALFFSAILIFANACVSVQGYRKPGVDFSQYKRIAVVQFDCFTEPTAGQEASDMVTLSFIKMGYHVIERSQLQALIDEATLATTGLTAPEKQSLKINGLDALVVGSVSTYSCVPSKQPIYYMNNLIAVLPTNSCMASLSLKMLDIENGDILWAANGSHRVSAMGMTANKVLQQILVELEKQIPTRENSGAVGHQGGRR